jgi:hypothetical protein
MHADTLLESRVALTMVGGHITFSSTESFSEGIEG